MKKYLPVLLVLLSAGITLAQNRYYTPVVDKKMAKHHPRAKAGILRGELTRSDASRIRAEYRHVRKTELRAKSEAKAANREIGKHGRKQDKQSWDAYRQNHSRHGKVKVNKTHRS